MKINWNKVKGWIFADSCNSENDNEELSYGDLLGLAKDFKFVLIKNKVTDQSDFDGVTAAAKTTLAQDLKRLGQDFSEIPAALKNNLMGCIGSMTILGDDDGKLTVKFHMRDSEGLWDGISKKHPEKDTTSKYKYEVFFPLEEDED